MNYLTLPMKAAAVGVVLLVIAVIGITIGAIMAMGWPTPLEGASLFFLPVILIAGLYYADPRP